MITNGAGSDPKRRERRPGGGGSDESRLRAFLRPGERLLWSGKPTPGLDPEGWMQGCGGLMATAFGGGFGLLVLWGPLSSPDMPLKTMLFLGVMGIVPLAILATGVILLAQPARNRDRARRSTHALTTERLMTLVRRDRADELVSIGLDQIGPMAIAMGADGRGTIAIDTHTSRDPGGGQRVTRNYALLGIADAQAVHDQILALKAERGLT